MSSSERMSSADMGAVLGAALEGLPMGVAILSAPDLEYVYANPAFLALATGEHVVGGSNAEAWPEWAYVLDEAAGIAHEDQRWVVSQVADSASPVEKGGTIELRHGPLAAAGKAFVLVLAERGRAARSAIGTRAHSDIHFESYLTVTDGVGVLVVTGDLDTSSAPQFERAVRDALLACTDPLVVDLSRVTYIESLAFGSLIAASGRAGDRHMAIACPRPEIMHLFEVAGLVGALNVGDSVESAKALLGVRRG